MFFRVEDIVGNAPLVQGTRDLFTVFDTYCAHQDWLPCGSSFFDVVDYRSNFRVFGFVYEVCVVLTFNGTVGRHRHDIEAVGVSELGCFGGRGTCHACKLVVQPKVILKGDSCESLVLCFYAHSFFSFHCLMQTFAPASTVKDAAGEFVNDSDLTVLYDVVAVSAI